MQEKNNMNFVALQVQFRHMPQSSSIKHLVRKQAGCLEKFARAGSHCEVVVDEMNHWNKGGIFKVTIRYTIPGDRLYVAHAEEESGSHHFLYSAVRIAFDEIERQLKKRRRRNYRRKTIELAA